MESVLDLLLLALDHGIVRLVRADASNGFPVSFHRLLTTFKRHLSSLAMGSQSGLDASDANAKFSGPKDIEWG